MSDFGGFALASVYDGILQNGITSGDSGVLHVDKFSPETIEGLRKALDYGDVIVKCSHCCQFGAVKTACRFCGAPIGA